MPREWLAGKIAAAATSNSNMSDLEAAAKLTAVTAQVAASLEAFHVSREVAQEWSGFLGACELPDGAAAGDGRRVLQKAIESLVAAALRVAAQHDGTSDDKQAGTSSMGQELVLLESKADELRTRLDALASGFIGR